MGAASISLDAVRGLVQACNSGFNLPLASEEDCEIVGQVYTHIKWWWAIL